MCLSLPLLVQEELVFVPLLTSWAKPPPSAKAFAGLSSYPLLSPAVFVTGACALGLRKPVVDTLGVLVGVGDGVLVGVLVGVKVAVGVLEGVGEMTEVGVAVAVTSL